MKNWLILTTALLCVAPLRAEIRSRTVEYRHGDTVLEGYYVYDDAVKGKRPGVLVVHDWMGLGEKTRKRADEVARLGYATFAADIYGKGVRPKDASEAGKLAGSFKRDRSLLRARAGAALDAFRKEEQVHANKIAAIGYCFGGTTVIELARSGADVAGIVSFHGGLDSPAPADGKNIRGKVLALHGADDPFVPAADLTAFEEEMRRSGVDWQLVAYGGAVHSFTDREAGTDNSKGAAYNEKADRRSWAAMKQFFSEIFP